MLSGPPGPTNNPEPTPDHFTGEALPKRRRQQNIHSTLKNGPNALRLSIQTVQKKLLYKLPQILKFKEILFAENPS